jgi:hypothetical protein
MSSDDWKRSVHAAWYLLNDGTIKVDVGTGEPTGESRIRPVILGLGTDHPVFLPSSTVAQLYICLLAQRLQAEAVTSKPELPAHFHPGLQCHWLGWLPDGNDGLVLHTPPLNFPDMAGCVDLAKSVMPGVRLITCMSQGITHTVYKLNESGWNRQVTNT